VKRDGHSSAERCGRSYRKNIRAHLATAAAAPNSDAKGKAYEALAVCLFSGVPGCIVERDVTNPLGTEQIDLAVGNRAGEDGLFLLPRVFVVECKDWDRPVDSASVGYFLNILAGRSIEVGILIAANGITGGLWDKTNAHALGLAAAPRGIRLIVITTKEIASLSSVADFIDLLHHRLLRAYATGAVGAPLHRTS